MININKTGGKVIASGGFGCVFSPALKCKTKKRNPLQITKLMQIKHAKNEYKEIQHFQKILSRIPNYTNYFLVDNFTICKPDKLDKTDLENYKKKCKALNKKGITETVINHSLNKVLALNMPNGGIDVGDFLDQKLDNNELIKLNNSLIDLLSKGILLMNKMNIYHCDIKESNVLVKINADTNTKNTKMYTRLIDWGLSTEYTDEKTIPPVLSNRPFQYNVPFSIILFNDEFIQYYKKFLNKYENPDYYMIREFVINYIFLWIDIRGAGHLKLINKIMTRLFINELPIIKKNKKSKFIIYDFTYYYIIEYICKILEKYTYNNSFHLYEYFNNVFIKNIDIWGFIMIYIPFIEKLHDHYHKLTNNEKNLFQNLKYIIVHFLFETPNEPIDTNKLANELRKLNNFFTKINNSNKKTKKNIKNTKTKTIKNII